MDFFGRKNVQVWLFSTLFVGYCPLAKGKLLSESPILKIAQDLGKTPAQVMIRWSIQNGVIAIPKSTKKERVLENFQVVEFHIILVLLFIHDFYFRPWILYCQSTRCICWMTFTPTFA